jgi:hypothetical protein
MAKDPAFLFYPGDASNDTQFMNRLERGAYFDLMKAQRLFGGYTTVQLRKVLGSDFEAVWPALELVLQLDGDKYFIGWLAESISKRDSYSKKQSERVKARWNNCGSTTVIPKKEIENGIENEDKAKTEKQKKTRFSKPTLADIQSFMSEVNMVAGGKWDQTKIQTTAKAFFNYYESNGWHVGRSPMKNWNAAVRNWMNREHTQTNKQNNGKTNSSREPLDAATIAAKHFGIPIPSNTEPSQDPQGQSSDGSFSDYQVVD